MEGKELGSSSQADLNIKQQGNKKKSQGQPITVMLECGYKVSYLRLFTSECAPNMTSPT